MIEYQINDIIEKAYCDGFYVTKFLDLDEQQKILQVRKSGLNVLFDGGYADAERLRAFVTQDKELGNTEIVILKAKISSKFEKITHRHVLGTIMSLGINRNTFGDIVLTEEEIYVFCTKEIVKVIKEIHSILHQEVEFIETDRSMIPVKEEKVESIIIPSLRLDAVVAKVMNTSRNNAQDIIREKRVFVNYVECTKDTYTCKINDILSIRKWGRIKILEMVKTTKKDRLLIKIGVKH